MGLREYLYEIDPQFDDKRESADAVAKGTFLSGMDDIKLFDRNSAARKRTLNAPLSGDSVALRVLTPVRCTRSLSLRCIRRVFAPAQVPATRSARSVLAPPDVVHRHPKTAEISRDFMALKLEPFLEPRAFWIWNRKQVTTKKHN
jgi:hypothetical protein